jgi:hypothetical protein
MAEKLTVCSKTLEISHVSPDWASQLDEVNR